MIEREAWLTMAEAYETPRGEDNNRWSLCVSILEMPLSARVRDSMFWVIDDAMPTRVWRGTFGDKYFCSPRIPANDKLRADFCRFQYYRLGGE